MSNPAIMRGERMALTLNCLHGAEIKDYLAELAQLRIEVFREYPYLYAGDHAYEMDYLRTYSQSPESVFVLASAGDRIVGISTGLPLNEAHVEFQEPFVAQNYNPQAIFYFGESVLLPTFRGQGLYARFFARREHYAQSLGRFRFATFCAVERPAEHPARPAGYRPLNYYWEKQGYQQRSDLRTFYSWRDLGAAEETLKPMVFWLKPLG